MSIVKLNNKAVSNATAFGSISSLGSMTFIKKLTASASATLSFVDGSDGVVLDDTYKEYMFTFNNIHPSVDGASFQVNFRDGDTAYDATKTSSTFGAYHKEDDTAYNLSYDAGKDLAQSTAAQKLDAQGDTGADNDQCGSGFMTLFNPSSTTFVKHFIARLSNSNLSDFSIDSYTAGYCNVTAAIDGVQFSYSSGNIDAGDICLYGIA